MSKREFVKRMKEEGYKVVTFYQADDKTIFANVVKDFTVSEVYVSNDVTYATIQTLSSVCIHKALEITGLFIGC